jgi:SAM-dependent methyltransferase
MLSLPVTLFHYDRNSAGDFACTFSKRPGKGSAMTDRVSALRSMLKTEGFGLEIGPSYSPLLPKAEGFNVEVLDHASQEELRKKYEGFAGVDIDKIEIVDFISDGRPMTDVIGMKSRYDYIVASHVIEHTPDLVGFLQDCAALLKEGGSLLLAIPDKRFCFDVFRPPTSVGQIVQAHVEKRTRHVAGTILDNFAMLAERGKNIVWPASDTTPIELRYSLTETMNAFRQIALTEPIESEPAVYHDAHAWTFTPSSFRYIISVLFEIEYVTLREAHFELPGSFEFFIALSKSGVGSGISHNELLRRSLEELKAIET